LGFDKLSPNPIIRVFQGRVNKLTAMSLSRCNRDLCGFTIQSLLAVRYPLETHPNRSLFALLTTVTEDNAIAAPAIMGLSSRPKAGYSRPAAMGMLRVL